MRCNHNLFINKDYKKPGSLCYNLLTKENSMTRSLKNEIQTVMIHVVRNLNLR